MCDSCQTSEIVNEDTRLVNTPCSECETEGIAVDTQTVKALLAVSLENVRSVDYRFCPDENCSVVYFSVDGEQIFHESDLRERVFQKSAGDESVNVCYCFDITPTDIRTQLTNTGSSTAVERINTGIKKGQCACDIRNPQGTCCLSNVRKLVKQMTVEVEPTRTN